MQPLSRGHHGKLGVLGLDGLRRTACRRIDNCGQWRTGSSAKTVFVGGRTSEGQWIEQRTSLLFVSFETPAKGQLEVTSDIKLPHYEVKVFNEHFAIIHFDEPLPPGKLEITVRP